MDVALSALLNAVLTGGNSAIIAILAIICYGLWQDRARLLRQHDEAQARLDAVAAAQALSTREIVNAIVALPRIEPPS